MASWIFDSYTVPDADAPWYDSVMPEAQVAVWVTATPEGATAAGGTLAQRVNKPSIPATLVGECSEATKTAILALENTTFNIKTPFDATGKNWLLMRVGFLRWDNAEHKYALAGADPRLIYMMELLGR